MRYCWLEVQGATVHGSLELLHLTYLKLHACWLITSYLQRLVTPSPVFDFMNLTILDTSFKWNPAGLVFLRLASFTENTALKVQWKNFKENFLFM